MKNNTLHEAKNTKNDEFYTRYEDVVEELSNYDFRGKSVLCNCDDPSMSAFWKYFHLNFEKLGLKQLTATFMGEIPFSITYWGGCDENISIGIKILLKGTGDFRSSECLNILDECDVVVTNPPFSLFREFISVVMEHKKDFLVVGNINAITYKEIFPHIKNNKLWLGCRSLNRDMYFHVPPERQEWLLNNKKEGSAYKRIDGEVMGRLASACWFTNLDHTYRHQELDLTEKYSPERYPQYNNYEAINVNKISEIPCDYSGIMGVPITFLGKYNPTQFQIIGHEHDLNGDGGDGIAHGQFEVHGVGVYKRILIQRIGGVK